MTSAQPEQALQRQVASFLAVNFPPGGDVWWSTMPLGGGGRVRGAILRAVGTRKGMPDMLIIAPELRPIWLELKAPKGRVSDRQLACHANLALAHCTVAIVRSLDDVTQALQACGVTLRAR